ncbi:hypothetical protein UP17_25370 (plasmid) [Peribacillus simplex]|nr:hypothetical protein UP17_25370 [Peribacillus simplex]
MRLMNSIIFLERDKKIHSDEWTNFIFFFFFFFFLNAFILGCLWNKATVIISAIKEKILVIWLTIKN